MENPGAKGLLNASQMAQLSAITNGKEVAKYPLFCKLTLPSSSTPASLPFFATAKGGTQVVGATSVTMSAVRTNLQRANTIASPNDYILKSIRCVLQPATDFTANASSDKEAILMDSYCKMTIGAKEWFQIPTFMLSSGAGFTGFASTTASGTERMYIDNNHPLIYKVDPWIVIPSDLNFNFEMIWDTAPSLNGNVDITIVLDGDIVRPIQ